MGDTPCGTQRHRVGEARVPGTHLLELAASWRETHADARSVHAFHGHGHGPAHSGTPGEDHVPWLHAWPSDAKNACDVLGPGLQRPFGFLPFGLRFPPWLHRLPHFPHLL